MSVSESVRNEFPVLVLVLCVPSGVENGPVVVEDEHFEYPYILRHHVQDILDIIWFLKMQALKTSFR